MPMQPSESEPSLLKKQKEYKEKGKRESPFMQRNVVEPIRLISARGERKAREGSPDIEKRKSNKVFLPLEMYDPLVTEEDPNSLVEMHRDEDGRTYAYSRYFDKQRDEWQW